MGFDDGSRWRSLVVQLTVMGVAGAVFAAPYIPEGTTMRRNVYSDRESCQRDYSPPQCQPGQPGGSGGSGGGGSGGGGGGHGNTIWRGPEYYADRQSPVARSDPGPGRTGMLSTKVETSVRGGFGKVGRFLRIAG